MRTKSSASVILVVLAFAAGCTTFTERFGEGEVCKSQDDCKRAFRCLASPDDPAVKTCQVPAGDVLDAIAGDVEIVDDALPSDADIVALDVPVVDGLDVMDVADVAKDADIVADADVTPTDPGAIDPGADLPDVADVQDIQDIQDILVDTGAPSTIGNLCNADAECTNPPAKCVNWATSAEDGTALKRCSGACTDACPEGMYCTPVGLTDIGYDLQCMPHPEGLCSTCKSNLDCPAYGSLCLMMTGGKFCGIPCFEGWCPDGFQCVNVDNPSVQPKFRDQCIPIVGTCACTPEVATLQFPCAVTVGEDSCYGNMTCDPMVGWSRCQAFYPEPEICDGKDNNCRDGADEGFEGLDWDGSKKKLGEPCGTGACAGGFIQCASDKASAYCSSLQRADVEACDGMDNDCNGLTDEIDATKNPPVPCTSEDIDGDADPNTTDCDPYDAAKHHPNAEFPIVKEPCCPLATAEADRVALCDYDCDNLVKMCPVGDLDGDGIVSVGMEGADCDDNNPLIYPNAPEKCGDGIDQNCDGNDLDCAGLADADGDGWNPPYDCNDDDNSVYPGAPEVCNYLDDDCDNITDEGNPGNLEQAGNAPCGSDVGECNPGRWSCTHYAPSGLKMECQGARTEKPEKCNNLDDDCDGSTDEDFPTKNNPCDGDDLDQCKNGVGICSDDELGVDCLSETIVDIEENCTNGKDDDCNGFVDDCLPKDKDGDGYAGATDCDDRRPEVHPGSIEPCCNPTFGAAKALAECDWNCDGKIVPCDKNDKDMDGFVATSSGGDDCDDNDPQAFPGAPDKCDDGADQDCNGADLICAQIVDKDKDGYQQKDDCVDTNKDIHPWAIELCNYKDDDCDKVVDDGNPGGGEICGADEGACEPGMMTCVHDASAAKVELKCVPDVAPHAETCDGLDNNCNGLTDEPYPDVGFPCDGGDTDECKNGTRVCRPDGNGTWCPSEIVENIKEICDGLDNDCDGLTDEGFDYNGLALGADCTGIGDCGVFPGLVECSTDKARATCSTNADGSASLAMSETCDYHDNDCDGNTDDGMLYRGMPVGALCKGIGTCGLGKVECNADLGATCSTNPDGSDPNVRKEQCNGADDDCDGHTDEEVQSTPFDCYHKGVCAGYSIPAKCEHGKWDCDYSVVTGYELVEQKCDGLDTNCNGKPDDSFGVGLPCDGPDDDKCPNGKLACNETQDGTVCGVESIENIVEQCNGVDDDCDGETDEGFEYNGGTLGQYCVGLGECGGGTVVCSSTQLTATCSTNPDGNDPKVAPEKCNLLDDDCDGITDEDYAVGKACDGPDADSCATGKWVCNTLGNGVDCSGDTGTGSLEVCDGEDNDCNGQTDEGFKYENLAVNADCDGIGECGAGKVVCLSNQQGATCSTNPNAPDPPLLAAEICDGKDNDCDGSTDEGMEWKGIALGGSCTAPGVCGKVAGKVECSPTELVPTCSTLPNGSNSQGSVDLCDLLDNDCNGVTDDVQVADISSCLLVGVCQPNVVKAFCVSGKWVCDYFMVSGYEPISEQSCDGADNDCDGSTDEGYPTKGDPCDSDDSDFCQNGTLTCTDTKDALECSNETQLNITEKCSTLGVDDDCDGETDEEGAVGCTSYCKDADVDNYGVPDDKKCLCKKGQIPFYTTTYCTDCNDLDQTVKPGIAELCNGKDDNCDKLGLIDEGAAFSKKGQACDGSDPDTCANGIWVCSVDGKSLVCDGDTAMAEKCNGKDDDCNGLTDDGFPVGSACDGPDTDSCKYGTWTCAADGTAECTNETTMNLTETCNNKDDDCDGATDEDWPDKGTACDGPDDDLCKYGKFQCTPDGKKLVCGTETLQNQVEKCNNKDDDCDGQTDEEWPTRGNKCDTNPTPPAGIPPCATGQLFCNAAGTGVECRNDIECVKDTTCQIGGGNAPDTCLCGNITGCNSFVASTCLIGSPSRCVCNTLNMCTGGQQCDAVHNLCVNP